MLRHAASRLASRVQCGAAVPALASRALSTGSSFATTRTFSEADVAQFVRLTGDSNPLHAPGDQAIVPGVLAASLFPALIGSKVPGVLYLKQSLAFRSPLSVGAVARATVTVSRPSGRKVAWATEVRDDATGRLVVDGEALALLPRPGKQDGATDAAQQPPVAA